MMSNHGMMIFHMKMKYFTHPRTQVANAHIFEFFLFIQIDIPSYNSTIWKIPLSSLVSLSHLYQVSWWKKKIQNLVYKGIFSQEKQKKN